MLKIYSTELDKFFDSEEEALKAEKAKQSAVNEYANLKNEIRELDNWYAEAVKDLNEKLHEYNEQYDKKFAAIEEKRNEICYSDADLENESKKCCGKCKNEEPKTDFHFEYKSSENGREKEHFVANSFDEFRKMVEKFNK